MRRRFRGRCGRLERRIIGAGEEDLGVGDRKGGGGLLEESVKREVGYIL